jgi:hypothetical protein
MKSALSLSMAIFCLLWEMFQQINKIFPIGTPKISFANTGAPYSIIKSYWEVSIEHDVDVLSDLNLRMVFPFAIPAGSIQLGWTALTDACTRIMSLNYVTSTALPGDDSGSAYFVLMGANFTKSGKFYMEIKYTSIPATPGFYGMVRFSIISTINSLNHIIYAYNNHFINMYFYPAPTTGITVDTSPTSTQPNYNIVTKTFNAQMDVTITATRSSNRLYFRLDKQTLKYDSAQGCEVIDTLDTVNYQFYNIGEYICEFEDETGYKGLFLSLTTANTNFPINKKIRIQVKMFNQNLPGASALTVALMKRYEPQILEQSTLATAFSANSASFQTNFPRLFLGPSLNTASSNYPGVGLFTSTNNPNQVVFNSIRVDFMIGTDLPPPTNYYVVKVSVGTTVADTAVPLNYIFDNLSKTPTSSRKITSVSAMGGITEITIINVGELSSLLTYSVGFKLILYGGETPFAGASTLGTVTVLDSTGAILVSQTPAQNVNSLAKIMYTQSQASVVSLPTIFHTVDQTTPNTVAGWTAALGPGTLGVSGINTGLFGLRKSVNNYMFVKSKIGSITTTPAYLGGESYVEMITNRAIGARTYYDWTDNNAINNCIFVTDAYADDTANRIQSCYYEFKNKGTLNEEYGLFRILAKSTNFFWTSGNDHNWGFRYVDITVSHSMFVNDLDSAILDTYINLYPKLTTWLPYNGVFQQGDIKVRYLDNMHVLNNAALTNMKIEVVNYYRDATFSFTDFYGSSFIRVSGVLNGVDTFKAQKILLFFDQMTMQFLDTQNFEVGCAGSADTPVRCFYRPGISAGSKVCAAGPTYCTDPLLRHILEIHFTTSTIAVSNAQNIQILIPIKLTNSATHVNIPIQIGIASVHQGNYSSFNQLVEYVTTKFIKPPTNPPPAGNTLTTSPIMETQANINIASATRNMLPQIDTEIKGVIGSSYSSKFNVDCPNGQTTPALKLSSPNECDLNTADEFYSFTLCGEWNFMADPNFSVQNVEENNVDTPDIYRVCIKNLRYWYVDAVNAPSGAMKYCLFCPMFSDPGYVVSSTGNPQSRNFFNFILPDTGTHKWPKGTFSMFNGNINAYGVGKIVDYTLDSTLPTVVDNFKENAIRSVKVVPNVWYKDYKSMKLTLTFPVNNRLLTGGSIIIQANMVQPIAFIKTPNPFCDIKSSANAYKISYTCSATTATTPAPGRIIITVTGTNQEIPPGTLTLDLYGVFVNSALFPTTPVYTSGTFSVSTYTPAGQAATNMLDRSQDEAMVVTFDSFPSGSINVPDIVDVNTDINDQKAQTRIDITVVLGNGKLLYANDLLKIEFDSAPAGVNYDSTAIPFYCYATDNQGLILTSVKTCWADTPTNLGAGLLLGSEGDVQYNIFHVILENFDVINNTPSYSVKTITLNNGVGTYDDTQVMAAKRGFIPASIIPNLGLFTASKAYNFAGVRSEITFTISTSITPIEYNSRIIIQLHKDYDPSNIDNIHNCILIYPVGGTNYPLFCVIEKFRILEITGFPTNIAPASQFVIKVIGVNQPYIGSSLEQFYARLVDATGTLKESKVVTLPGPTALLSTLPALKMASVDNLAFSSQFIRSTTSLTFDLTLQTALTASSDIHVYLNYYSYEYASLPETNIVCTLKNVNTGSQIFGGPCSRTGKRLMMKPGVAVPANTAMRIFIDGLVTVNYRECDIKKIGIQVVSGTTLTDLLRPEYVNVQPISADLDPTLTYLNFDGMNSLSFITIKRGVYNRLNIIRMDGGRFNDELTYTLANTFNNQFSIMNPRDVEVRDSYFGEKSMPVLLGTSKTTILSIFLIGMNKLEMFKVGRFAPLPFLIIKTTPDKLPLPVPSTLKVYRGYESLAMILTLYDLPQADLPIAVSTETFDSGNLLVLKSPAAITMSKTSIISELVVKYTMPITSDPVSVTSSNLVLTVPDDAPYQTTKVAIQVVDLVVDTSTKFEVKITDTTPYGCFVTISVHMPLTVYYYIVPRYLYASITADYIDDQLKKGIRTDGYIIYGKMNVESTVKDFDLCNSELMANTSYVVKMFYKTFIVQNIQNQNQPNLQPPTFDPLARPNFDANTQDQNSVVGRIDNGLSWVVFSTDSNSAQYGYIDLTFAQSLSTQNKKDLCCYFGQMLSYPLENIWTSDSVRCESVALPVNITYFAGINYVKPVRRVLEGKEDPLEDNSAVLPLEQPSEKDGVPSVFEEKDLMKESNRILQNTNSNIVRLYLMRNLRQSQDSAAWPQLTSLVFKSSFDSGLQSQYPSMPLLTKKTPLLEIEQISASIENFANFTLNDDGKSGNLTGIKLKSAGTVFSIVLMKKPGLDQAMTYQHIKLGKNPLDMNAAPVATFNKYFASINEDYLLTLPDMTLDQTYALYYYGISLDPNLVPAYTPIYKYEFIIRGKIRSNAFGNLYKGLTVALGLVFVNFAF